MSKVAKSLICRGCLNLVTSAHRSSVDIGASAKLELVDKFCYLGDMLSADGDADAAMEVRIRIGWNKFRQLVLGMRMDIHPDNRISDFEIISGYQRIIKCLYRYQVVGIMKLVVCSETIVS